MTWIIKIESRAAKALKALDRPIKQRIETFIDQLTEISNPRSSGKALHGGLSGLWRYRIEDYRLVAQIKDNELVILLLEIGHRKDIYK